MQTKTSLFLMILIATLGVGIAIYLSGCTHRDKPTTPNQPIPNQPPTAKITLPNDGDSFAEGYAIVFMGSAVDSEDGVLTDSSLVWASSLDGQIGMGTDFSNSYLSVGSHSIVLTATDSGNKQASDSITVIVNQTPPGAVVYSFSSPGNCPIGLGWDGSYLWNSDDCAGKIYKIDPSKGWIIDLFSSPDSEPSGLTWDGSYLWCTGMSKDKIYKLDPSDGSIVDSFSSPGGSPIGLAWDGTYFWNADVEEAKIYQLDPSDGSVKKSFSSPGDYPSGLAWDGNYLWCADVWERKIYKINPSNGSIISSYSSPAFWSSGLTWNGKYLWLADLVQKKIYKIKPWGD